jgi:multimeric flavodoxin WrbA/RimJ/RimL family protein N-acetyltransferase
MREVIGYNGSPRCGGNTELLLDAILAGAAEAGAAVMKVDLAARSIAGCRACGGCDADGQCVVDDDMRELYAGLTGAAHLVLAAPVYFGGLPAQAKALVDRCQAIWRLRGGPSAGAPGEEAAACGDAASGNRKALFASVAGMPRPSMFDGPLATVKTWFAALEVQPMRPVLVPDVDARGDLDKDPPTLDRARAAGRLLGGGAPPSLRQSAPGFLRGRGVWLRPLRPGDLERRAVWSMDRESVAIMTGRAEDAAPTLEAARAQVAKWWAGLCKDPDSQQWAIIHPEAGYIGDIDFYVSDRERREVGIVPFVGEKAYRGRGIGSAALGVILDYAAGLGMESVAQDVLETNAPARRAFAKLGFREEGHIERNGMTWLPILLDLRKPIAHTTARTEE